MMEYSEYWKRNRRGTTIDKAVILSFTTNNPQQAREFAAQYGKDCQTVKKILSIKDRDERLRAIQRHIDLFD